MTARTHFGDPCIHCGFAHDDFPAGPCTGTGKPKPIAYAMVERRWDGVERYRVRFSDSSIEERYAHVSEHLPYWHFGHSEEFTKPPRYDAKLKDTPR